MVIQLQQKKVIEDAKNNGVEEFWFMGDLFMPGPGRGDLLELLIDSNTTTFVKGNWDSCFTSIIEEYDTINFDDPEDIFISELVKYVFEGLTTEQIEFVFNIPMYTEKIVNGTKFFLSHNLPNKNFGGDLAPNQPDESFVKLFEVTDAKVAIFGLIHTTVMRQAGIDDLRRIINPGAVSTTMGRPCNYSILKVEDNGKWSVEFRFIEHDYLKVLDDCKNNQLPYYDLYEDTMLNHIVHTHNAEGIQMMNDKYGYKKSIRQWLKDEDTLRILNKYKERFINDRDKKN